MLNKRYKHVFIYVGGFFILQVNFVGIVNVISKFKKDEVSKLEIYLQEKKSINKL